MANAYEYKNAPVVLSKVEKYIEEGRKLRIEDVYDELSIFDWWKDYLTVSNLKEMKRFLQTAIRFGFDGYVCFKVGITGCSNGMWANVEPSTTGYSPDCDFLYRSFTPAYVEWDVYRNGESATAHNCLPSRVKAIEFLENEVRS